MRISPDDADGQLLPSHNNNTGEQPEERMLPRNDPERDWGEVRDQRLPPEGRTPERIYVCFSIPIFLLIFRKNVA